MKHILLFCSILLISFKVFAQPNPKFNNHILDDPNYLNGKLYNIQKFFERKKYNGVIERTKDLLVTHHNFDSASLHIIYSYLIASISAQNYTNQFTLYREKAVQYGVNVDSIYEVYNGKFVVNKEKKIKSKNFNALDIEIGNRIPDGKHYNYRAVRPIFSFNYRLYVYATPKSNFIFNLGVSNFRYLASTSINVGNGYLLYDSKYDQFSINFIFGYDIALFSKAQIRVAPTLNFSMGSIHTDNIYFEKSATKFKIAPGLSVEKRFNINKLKFGIGVNYNYAFDFNPHYVGAFLRFFH